MPIGLIDAIIANRLEFAGLPRQVAPEVEAPGAVTDPNYGFTSATVTSSRESLSNYGQVLSAASSFLDNSVESRPRTVNSTNADVATASVAAGATAGAFAVNVTRTANVEQRSTAVVADPAAANFSIGAFSIQLSNASAGTVVNVAEGSLNGVRDAINAAGAGVTARIDTDAFGSSLTVVGNETGATAPTFSFNATGGPFDSFAGSLAALGFTQTQGPGDAAISVTSSSGTENLTSSSNDFTFGNGVTVTAQTAGTTTVNVSENVADLQARASQIVSNTNALLGTLNNRAGNDQADALRTDLFAQFTPSQVTALSNIGITRPGGTSSDALAINTTTLNSFFSSASTADQVASSEAISTLFSNLRSTVSGFAGTSGSITTAAQSAFTTGFNDAKLGIDNLLNTLPGRDPSREVPDFVSQLLAQRLFTGSLTALPGFSVFA